MDNQSLTVPRILRKTSFGEHRVFRRGERTLSRASALDRGTVLLAFLVILLAASFVLNIVMGAVSISFSDLLAILFGRAEEVRDSALGMKANVLFAVRIPRTLVAILTGGALGLCGALMQALFRNPLADPGLLGVSSGAAVGASSVIVMGAGYGITAFSSLWLLPLAAFVGAMITTLLVWYLGTRDGQSDVSTMLLAGIAINALAGAITGVMVLLSNDSQLRSLTFWSLGSLNGSTWVAVGIVGAVFVLTLLVVPFLPNPLNALLLGEHDAACLGVPVESFKKLLILLTSINVGVAVAFTGMIGFVGLIAPHGVRLLAGPNHATVLPGSILAGAVLLLNSDLVARTMVAPAEVPIGIVTAIAGAPFFLWLLLRSHQRSGF